MSPATHSRHHGGSRTFLLTTHSLGGCARSARRDGLLAGLIAAAFRDGHAPALHWQQFTNGGENGVVITALELRRGESDWLVPTLFNERRTKKPPLATWVSAMAMRPATVAPLDDPDPARRDAAYDRLAWEIRWRALMTAALALLVVCGLGATLAPLRSRRPPPSWARAAFWLRWTRWATTDMQLTLSVVAVNLCFAQWLLRGRRWVSAASAARAAWAWR